MGKNQSKAFKSLVPGLNLPNGDEKAAKPGSSKFHVHSSSLDSISTAVSTGTEQQPLVSHSDSMDNLIRNSSTGHNSNPGSNSSGSKFMRRKDDRVYDTLVESASVLTTFSDQVIQNADARSNCTTQVPLPPSSSGPDPHSSSGIGPQSHHEIRTEVESCPANAAAAASSSSSRCHRSNSGSTHRKQEVGGAPLDDAGEGGASCRRSHSHRKNHIATQKDHQYVEESEIRLEGSDPYLHPALHPEIVKKLSQEEWEELISYTCATLSQTLLASILEKVETNHLLLQHSDPNTGHASKNPERNGEHSLSQGENGQRHADVNNMCMQSIEDLLRKLRASREEAQSQRGSGGERKSQEQEVGGEDQHHNERRLKLERTSSLPPPHSTKHPLKTRNSVPNVKTDQVSPPDKPAGHSRHRQAQNGLTRESTWTRLEQARERLLQEEYLRTHSGASSRDHHEGAGSRANSSPGHIDRTRFSLEGGSDSRGCPEDDYSDVNTRERLEIVRARLLEDSELQSRRHVSSGHGQTRSSSSRSQECPTSRDDLTNVSVEAVLSLEVENSRSSSSRQHHHHHRSGGQRKDKAKCIKCEGGSRGNGGGRRKKGRSRSDGHHRDHHVGDQIFVDTSLDDDCPGVFENRVRRHPRHQHYICKQCLSGSTQQGGGAGSKGRRGSGGKQGSSTASHENTEHSQMVNGSSHSHATPPSSHAGGSGPALVMTLEDAAFLLERSTKFVENDSTDENNNSPPPLKEGTTSQWQDGSGGSVSPINGPGGVPSISGGSPKVKESVSEEDEGKPHHHYRDAPWGDFPYPSKPLRSGRDSPAATDMAVACLDMNSAPMLRPTSHTPHRHYSSHAHSMEWRGGEAGLQQHLHLHKHTHYHHIIHHHSQP